MSKITLTVKDADFILGVLRNYLSDETELLENFFDFFGIDDSNVEKFEYLNEFKMDIESKKVNACKCIELLTVGSAE